MSKKTGTVLLSEQSRRISLRCPVILASAKLMQDRGSGQYSITVDLEYPMSAAAMQAIHSVILVARIADRSGNAILTADGGELLAKQIRFGEEGFPCGESTTFSFAVDIDPQDGTRFDEPEVSVSRIHFEDGSIVDYLRGDFFPVPASPVPLEKKYDDEGIDAIRVYLGGQANFIPEKLSAVVWRCTCGELCQEEECANCGCTRTDVFDYFGDTEQILHPGFNFHKLLKIALIVVGSIVGVLALTLTAILLVKNHGSGDPSDTDTGKPIVTTEPEPDEDSRATERVQFYLDAKRYEDAWSIADKEAEAAYFKPGICESAISYFRELKDYDNACLFAQRLVEVQGSDAASATLAALYAEAYDHFTALSEWERACNLAKDKLSDSAKLSASVNSWITALKNGTVTPIRTSDRYSECLWVLGQYLPENTALQKDVVREGVNAFLSENKFTEAEEFAAKDPDGGMELQYEIRRSAVNYYLGRKEFLQAFEAAKRTDDAELIATVCEQIPDSEIRANLPSYISYLWGSPEKLQKVLAHTIAQNRFAARVNGDGTVSFGANLFFDPAFAGYGDAAISVAVGTSHTAVLLDNGRVVVLNQAGQVDKKNSPTGFSAIAISAAGDYTLVLLENGKVLVAGTSPFDSSAKTKINGLTDVISIAAGEKHALFLRANGSVVAVGDNGKGQCAVDSWTDIVQIAAGDSHSVGLKSDGTLVGCGNSANGRMDFSGWTKVISICAGQSSTAAIRQDGSVLFAGGTIGAKPADPTGLAGITEIAAGQFGMIVKDGSGRVYSRGEYAPDLDGFPG